MLPDDTIPSSVSNSNHTLVPVLGQACRNGTGSVLQFFISLFMRAFKVVMFFSSRFFDYSGRSLCMCIPRLAFVFPASVAGPFGGFLVCG